MSSIIYRTNSWSNVTETSWKIDPRSGVDNPDMEWLEIT